MTKEGVVLFTVIVSLCYALPVPIFKRQHKNDGHSIVNSVQLLREKRQVVIGDHAVNTGKIINSGIVNGKPVVIVNGQAINENLASESSLEASVSANIAPQPYSANAGTASYNNGNAETNGSTALSDTDARVVFASVNGGTASYNGNAETDGSTASPDTDATPAVIQTNAGRTLSVEASGPESSVAASNEHGAVLAETWRNSALAVAEAKRSGGIAFAIASSSSGSGGSGARASVWNGK